MNSETVKPAWTSRERVVSFTSPNPNQPRQMTVAVEGREVSVFDEVEPFAPSLTELQDYVGTYYSEELDYEQVLRITSNGLSMWDPKTWDELALRPFMRDVFRGQGRFVFSRDIKGRVVGFTFNRLRIRNLKFVKRIEQPEG